ncbi:MAG: nickel-dependent lactate racemase [Clostridiales bacterium]|nr:MAG: nickel-dependent lactate racemase [Clostridiales bacterium]
MSTVNLKYGKTSIEIDLDGAKSIDTLVEKPMREIEDIEKEFRYSIEDGVIGVLPLKDLIKSDDKVTVIISDLTRFWMRQDIICSLLVKYLREDMNIPTENIAVLIALGTHRKNTEEEKKTLAGEYAYNNCAMVVDHDCDADDLEYVGTTSMGTEVYVNPLAVGRKVIVISGTVHHLMAGYGGGRKSIVPGIAGRKTIKMNHIRALDVNEPKSDERVGSGKFTNNPINIDMLEAGRMVNPVFGINICVNSASKHSGLFSGDFEKAWKESCMYIQKSYGLPIEKEYDVVFVSCGGFPKDLNFYQSSKSLFNGIRAMKDGGTIVLLAQCGEGSGAKDFFDWIEPLKRGCLDESLRKDFTIGGYIFYAACEAIRRGNVLLLSELEPEEIKDMGVISYNSLEELMRHVDVENKEICVIPYGGSVLPQLHETYDELIKDIK